MSGAGIAEQFGSGSIRASILRSGWISSPAYDFFFLICAPLVTVPIMAGVLLRIPILAIVCATMLAFTHYSSTAAFYFWKENQEYYRSRWIAFYAGPVVLAAVFLLLLGFQIPYFIQLVLFFWNTWHVSRQNCGILAIYRSRAGVSDPLQKPAANAAIISVAMFFCVWNIGTHQEVSALFNIIHPAFTRAVKFATGGVAAVFVARFLWAVVRRKAPIGIPEGLFLVTSFAFFYPYLIVRDSGYATLFMLLPHYVQYIALVWLLHRRKFGGTDKGVPVLLRQMSSKLIVLVPILIAVGFGFAMVQNYARNHGLKVGWEALYLLIAFEHFYLDGLIWSFRRPHVRQTILPFLLQRPAARS